MESRRRWVLEQDLISIDTNDVTPTPTTTSPPPPQTQHLPEASCECEFNNTCGDEEAHGKWKTTLLLITGSTCMVLSPSSQPLDYISYFIINCSSSLWKGKRLIPRLLATSDELFSSFQRRFLKPDPLLVRCFSPQQSSPQHR